jgi:hypothetical protein
MNALAPVSQDAGALMESVIAKGDLSKLTPAERSKYYVEVCKSVGLNPLTQPFAYITLNNKLTLYALRTCTDQLRAIHGVSVVDLAETERDGVYVVTAKVQDRNGRTDMAKGAVTISSLKGDALANALMKAETKAKRRATLSVCGLGFLDESEIETIPANGNAKAISAHRAKKERDATGKTSWEQFQTDLDQAETSVAVAAIEREWLSMCEAGTVPPKWANDVRDECGKRLASFDVADQLAASVDPIEEAMTSLPDNPVISANARARSYAERAKRQRPPGKRLTGADAIAVFRSLNNLMQAAKTKGSLEAWANEAPTQNAITSLPDDMYQEFRDDYASRLHELPQTILDAM